jgi:hypothetical protein
MTQAIENGRWDGPEALLWSTEQLDSTRVSKAQTENLSLSTGLACWHRHWPGFPEHTDLEGQTLAGQISRGAGTGCRG